MEEIIELFGHKHKIVKDNGSEDICEKCSLQSYCDYTKPQLPCETEDCSLNRHFELIPDKV